jgi:type I restriction enzyme S subunit
MMNLQKNNWRTAKLGEVCAFEYGGSLREKERNGGEFPVYGSAGIVGWHDEALTQSATLVIGRKGSVGNVFYSETPCFPIDTTYFIEETKTKENLQWLLYFLVNYDLRRLNMATAVPGLNRNVAYQIEIPLPPLDEQQRIVELFQSIEQAIVHAEEQEANLLQLKNQLLRDLFGEKRQFGNYLSAKDFDKVKFENIVLNISERVEPKDTELDIYVGLEHLDSDDLVIRRKGKPEDVIGTKLKIFKGDIIFGKRRAYLRKVAVADFEGIVSAHSMVLRANEENIEKDFLPYFMQSDEFMNRAVQISEGSLSPTIKWKTLAQQEFILPKRVKQAKLIDVFKQFDEARELIHQQKETLKKLKQKLLNEILG